MRRFLSFLLVVSIIIGVPFSSAAIGGAFLIMDGRTLEVLEQENGNVTLPMASTTKVMTALLVIENASLSDVVTIPKQAVGIEGSALYVKEGERYSVEQLLYALLLRSANDCAVALACHVGEGNAEKFVDMMNERAKAMSLKDTCFKNPSGLPQEGHYTTAYELAKIMAEAMKHPEFCEITAAKQYEINGQSVVNHNKLLSRDTRCIGGKTGYTKAAGRCLVTVAKQTEVPLICVTLGRANDWEIHSNAYDRWFDQMKIVTLQQKETLKVSLPIAGGGEVQATNCNQVALYRWGIPNNVETKVIAGPFIYGNKAKGETVGAVEYWCDGAKIGESPLILCTPVSVSPKKELLITRFIRFFRRIFLKNN